MIPQLGDRVHYVAHGSADGTYPRACRLATVTGTGGWVTEEVRTLPDGLDTRRVVVERWAPDAVAAHVQTPTGWFIHEALEHDAGAAAESDGPLLCTGRAHGPGTWHWPGVG